MGEWKAFVSDFDVIRDPVPVKDNALPPSA